jgi:phosphoribosylformimino-5-aminoimidazole carboxamide ribotide isomerase
MILFPAIDLKDGKCVRLKKGAMDDATIYNDDPAAQARQFMEIGFSWLHVVDLDGAIAGETKNGEAVDAVLWHVANSMKVQLGGGIRDRACLDDWLEKGVARVVLGTAALRDPDLVRKAARDHPGRIAVGIDARGGKVAVEGWSETSDMEAVDLAKRFEDAGVAAIVYTDIDRDGVLAGVNWEATIALAEAVSIPVIASGGVASIADIERLRQPDAAKLEGAIVGRALYDGRIDPKAALKLLAAGSPRLPR